MTLHITKRVHPNNLTVGKLYYITPPENEMPKAFPPLLGKLDKKIDIFNPT